jgi:protein-tyrosine phosphatase
MKQVLFLCSGNYYRSRFAEQLFNWLAERAGVPWRAESRGLIVGSADNIGPISQATLAALRLRGVRVSDQQRDPQPLTAADLARTDHVVAVKAAEHQRMMREQFPAWSERVEYWHVDDLDCAGPEVALPHLEREVRALLTRLSAAEETACAEVA